MKLRLFSYPKINLALDILRKDKSGYHEIQTVFHQLQEPYDEIILEECDEDIIKVKSDHPKLSMDKTNTVLKAANLLKQQIGIKKGARIFIKKRIPLMSGLGGGASNAVAVLKGLARLWKISCCHQRVYMSSHGLTGGSIGVALIDPPLSRRMTMQENDKHSSSCLLLRIANQIGMDCNFFFDGGTALGEHFGEKITPLPPLPLNMHFEIIETGIEISSYLAYQHIDVKKCGKNIEKTKKLIELLRAAAAPAGAAAAHFHNDFEEFIFTKFPRLLQQKQNIESERSDRVFLAGSGGGLIKYYINEKNKIHS